MAQSQSQVSRFEYIARLKFASVLRYSTDHTPEHLLADNYFGNALNYLAAGDEIDVICHTDDGGWVKGRLEVLNAEPDRTVVQLLGMWRSSNPAQDRVLQKVYNASTKKWDVKDGSGKTVARGLTKDEAGRIASDIEEKEAA